MNRTAVCALLATAALATLGCGSNDVTVAPSGSSGTTTGSGGASAGSGGAGSTATTSGPGGAGSGGATPVTCPEMAVVPGVHDRSLMHDGNMREYEVQVPLSYDNSHAVPLVFDLHGYTSNKDQQELVSGFSAKAEAEGFIVVRPNGFGAVRSWNAGDFCCGSAQMNDLDDVGLMKAIAAAVQAEACIDPKRIYATGISNGGAMSHRLACEAADVFAAVAPVSYPIDFNPLTKCQPSRPIAVMHSHGLNDIVVPYNGNTYQAASPDSFAQWAQADGCSGPSEVTYSKGNSQCETYKTCSAGVEVSLCSVNGGHILYSNADNVPIADLAWDFLSRFTLP